MAEQESKTDGDSQNTVYRQLESYDWEKDKEFQGGLSAILGSDPSPDQIQDLTIRAQCFYLSRKRSIPINFSSYKIYLINKYPERFQPSRNSLPSSSSSINGDPPPAKMKLQEPLPSSLAGVNELSNMQTSPSSVADGATVVPLQTPLSSSQKAIQPPNFFVDPFRDPLASSIELPPIINPRTQEPAPYPPTFTEIVALITSGAEVPGIKDIPDVVYPISMAAKPTAQRRRKPWEKDIPEDIILNGMKEGTFGDQRDYHIVQELPEEN